MSTTYTICELARELDITTRAIRFYEEQGMLSPERRGHPDPSSGNQKQVNTMLEKIAERRAQLEQQLLDIEQMQLELDTAEERCRAALIKSYNKQPVAT